MFINKRGKKFKGVAQSSPKDFWFATFAFFIPLFSSLILLGTDFTGGQSGELFFGIKHLGLVQTPGMPVYLFFSKIITYLLPWGNAIWKTNFISLFFGALSSLMFYLTARRLHFPQLVSLASGLLLFFSPFFWSFSLITHHITFHVFLVLLCIYLTLRLLAIPTPSSFSFFLLIWSFLCGITASAHVTFMTWAITLLVLGLALGLPRHRASGPHYVQVFLGLSAGILLPLIYLPLKIISSNMFFNSDYAYQYATLTNVFSLSRLSAWFFWYVTGGHEPIFWIQTPTISMLAIWREIWQLIKSWPFLPIIIMFFGLLANLRSIFLRQVHPVSREVDETGRLIVSLVPLIALGGSILLSPQMQKTVQICLTLGGAYWSLKGLEYCYYKLGQSHILNKNKRIRPALFGVIIVCLVPAFAFMQSHLTLYKSKISADTNQSTLMQATSLLQRLPENSILVYPKFEQGLLLRYIQESKALRPDIKLLPFSYYWYDHPYYGPSFLKSAHEQQTKPYYHQLNYMRYWTKQLSKELSKGTPVYFMATPMPQDSIVDYFLQSFQLEQVFRPLRERIDSTTYRYFSFYRVRSHPMPLPPIRHYHEPASLGFVENHLQLLSGSIELAGSTITLQPLINAVIHWRAANKIPVENYYIQFRLNPKRVGNRLPLFKLKKKKWQVTRRLSKMRLLNKIRRASVFSENYQLQVPLHSPAGTYQLELSVIDTETNERFVLGEKNDKAIYFLPICTFDLPAVSESIAGLSNP